MANEAEADKAAQTAPKSKKKLLMMVGAAVVVALLGGGGYVMVFGKSKSQPEQEKKVTSFIDLKEMVVGMAADSATPERNKFMKIKATLEVADEKQSALVQPLLPRVEDLFHIYLRDLRPADLQGTAGVFRLKEELLRRVNIAVQPAHVDAILFKEVIVQ